MKRLAILFLVACIMAVGCENNVTNNVINNIDTDSASVRAMETIEEAGGTPDSSAEGIANFLSNKDYSGVFVTEAGFVGYKIKDAKIYYIEKLNDTNDKWTEITEGIAVDKNLNKLEYQTEDGLEILTFDGFGYRYYSKNGGRVIYYKKSDYLDKFAGIYCNKEGIGICLVINDDGAITRYSKNNGRWGYGRYTSMVVLEGNVLTFKGADGSIFAFFPNHAGTGRTGVKYLKAELKDYWLSQYDELGQLN